MRKRQLSDGRLFESILVGLCLSCGIQFNTVAAPLTPPPIPSVRPLIAKKYSTDSNGDRVDDRLFDKASQAVAAQKSARTPDEKTRAQAALNQMVEVELIFGEQVKQQQIDTFTQHGGEITYMYKAVSYGWNGRVPVGKITALPAALGDSVVFVKEPRPMKLHMDTATKTGRVRPVWASGFAGNVAGYDGSTNITIGILDTGVDESHTDFAGRRVYWQDFSSDNSPTPVDMFQHGSHVAGIALGSGASAGSAAGTLFFSEKGSLDGVPSGLSYSNPIELPASSVTMTATARWVGGGSATFRLYSHTKGLSDWTIEGSATGTSPLTFTKTFTPSASRVYSPELLSNGSMGNYAINSQVSNHPASGDGFNKFRGVAPGCNWAGAKVFSNAGAGFSTWTEAAVDDMVANRAVNNIKIINLSLGTIGDPGLDPAGRQKINTAANNGIVVVVSAGNDGGEATIGQREIDDPGRAALALTVGAANDVNQLTTYTSVGFASPGSDSGQEEDYKPDLMAPGGSSTYYSSILSVDSNSADGGFADQKPNDYYNIQGTSMAAPFAAGCAALVIDAIQQSGTSWDFNSSEHVRLVKMLLCATASESNTNREGNLISPTLQRATAGPSSFPAGKDKYEGYGMINPDAAVEAVSELYTPGATATNTFGSNATDRRVWGRKVNLLAGQAFTPSLTNPASGDFDFYLYSMTPTIYGAPIILASSTLAGTGVNETFTHTSSTNTTAILVAKRISGFGTFTLTSPGTGTGSAPVLSGIEGTTLAYVENQSPPAITSSLAVTDGDSPSLAGATVSIVTNFASGQDLLAMTPNPQNGISASYNSSSGILTLSGSSSVANYQTALRTVTYANSSETPSLLTRTALFKVNDGTSDSNPQTRKISVTGGNDAPVLAAIADQTIDELTTLTLTNSATDSDTPLGQLTFSISNAPPGMALNSTTGVLTWTPTEAQGPSTNTITVSVNDHGSPAMTNSQTFLVVVREVNLAPVLAVIPDRTIHAGTTFYVTNSVTDADLPTNTLTFLLTAAPTNSALHSSSGLLVWLTSDAQVNTTNNFTVRVFDNGTPLLSDREDFSVVVKSRPQLTTGVTNGVITLTWSSIPGTSYKVQFKDNLSDAAWTDLSTVTAVGSNVAVSNSPGARRFYRIKVL